MEYIKIIFACLISVFLGIRIMSLIFNVLIKIFKKNIIEDKAYWLFGFSAIIANFLGTTIIICLFKIVSLEGYFYAIILYVLFFLKNYVGRVINIKNNKSLVKSLMMLDGREEQYNKKEDLEKEYFVIFGGLVGVVLGIILFCIFLIF